MTNNRYFEEIGAMPRGFGPLARAYAIGFVLSLALTLAAYSLAVHHALPGGGLVAALIVLACTQFIVQVVCFLHLGRETASRERLVVLGCVMVIVLILVGGSLWIMTHLNERMMADPTQMEQYMSDQEGI